MFETWYQSISPKIIHQAKKIKLLICDVDGVFSDGRIYLGNQQEEYKAFHTRDGYGIKALQKANIDIAIITGRHSKIVENRMTHLGIKHVFQNCHDKCIPYQSLLQQLQLTPDEVAYIGDDIIDLEVMLQIGLSIAVKDAHPALLDKVDYITYCKGGFGAVREVCDLLLDVNDQLQSRGLSI